MTTVIDLSYLSPTSIGTQLDCEQKLFFRYVKGMREPSSEATATGHGLATALERDSLGDGLAAYDIARPPVDAVWDDADLRANERLVAQSTIVHAFNAYRDRFGYADQLAGVKRECTYITQTQANARLLARLDGVGSTYIVEDKLRSGSSLGAERIELEVVNSHQLTGEIYVVWKRTGVLLPLRFRLVKKPNRTKTKAMKLDRDAIDAFVMEHFANEGSIVEREVTRTLTDMHRFEHELNELWTRRHEIEFCDRRPVRNPGACFNHGRVCSFAEACAKDIR